jgi:hypothetical protein
MEDVELGASNVILGDVDRTHRRIGGTATSRTVRLVVIASPPTAAEKTPPLGELIVSRNEVGV